MNVGFDASAMITGIFPSPPGAGKGHPFELRAGPFFGGELQVVSLHGRERVNDVYRYEVTFATEAPPEVIASALFGMPACLTIKAPGHDPRVIQGIASSVEAIGAVPGEQSSKRRRYRLEIVPRLWLLRHRRRNRIFQNKTIGEIVDTILSDVGIRATDCHWRADRDSYAPLPFVYQRGETDWEFFRRLLASAGLFFFYEHANGFLDSMFGGAAGAVAGAVGAAAGMLGGAVGSAVSTVESVAGMVPVLNFGAAAGHTAAVTPALAGLAAEAVGAGLGAVAGAVGGPVGGALGAVASLVEEPSDTLPFDDGIGADADFDRVYEFSLRKELRTKELRMLDRDVEDATSWLGVASVAPVSLDISAGLSLSTKGLSAHVGASFDVDAPAIAPSMLRQEVYQTDLNVRQDAPPAPPPKANGGPSGLASAASASLASASLGSASLLAAYRQESAKAKRLGMELDRERRKYQQAAGASDCRRLGAGYRFTLGAHPIGMLNTEYTVTALDVVGVHPDFLGEGQAVYRNRFRCVPSSVAPRPKRPKRRPKPGMEVARVVGFAGAEKLPRLEANDVGYVRVRFYWDIADDDGAHNRGLVWGGIDDDVHAVWIPIVQPWAGAGYGAQFIPREGMDVLVGFLDDQSERPVILGCLHSRENRPPWPEEIDHQKIGIRSQTRPADQGYSEISIDDRQGGEVVKVRAQRDLNEEVIRDSLTHVHRDARTTVDGNQHDRVHQHLRLDVDKDLATTVGRNRVSEVRGNSTLTVIGDETTTVQGSERRHVQHDLSTVVSGRADIVTQGQHHESFENDAVARHEGHRVVLVGDSTTKRSTVLHVEGSVRQYASSGLEIEAVESLTITCGKSQIRMTPTAITFSSPKIMLATADAEIASSKKVVVTAQDSLSLGGGKVAMASSGASVALDSNATVQGSKVQLGGSSTTSSPADKAKVTVTTLTLADQDGNPVTGERVVLRKGGDGGEERMVVLDADAAIHITGDDPFDVLFADLPDAGKGSVSPPQKKPGDPKPLVIAQGDYMTKLAFRYGFDPDAVWNDPKNADLKKKRTDPNMLAPGDVLMVPENKPNWVSASIGSSNGFVATVPRVPVSVKFVQDGKPLANEPYHLQGLKPKPGDPDPATTDGDGCIHLEVPVTVTSFGVYLDSLSEVHRVRVGHLDPPDEPTGARMRLGLLGVLGRPGGREQVEGPDAELLAALKVFQRTNGLTVTGKLDAATTAKLTESFGY
jgi:type VI secretion system secreted protein VgrG